MNPQKLVFDVGAKIVEQDDGKFAIQIIFMNIADRDKAVEVSEFFHQIVQNETFHEAMEQIFGKSMEGQDRVVKRH